MSSRADHGTGATPEAQAEAELARLSERATARNRERATTLGRLCAQLDATAPDERWDEAAELAHQIAGSAGTFGRPRASLVARELLAALRGRTSEDLPRLLAELSAELLPNGYGDAHGRG